MRTQAGFSTTDITPPLGMEKPGGYGKEYIREIHDPLKARAAVFEQEGVLLAFLSLDTCYVTSREFIQTLREEVERRTGIPAAHLLFTTSHTHSGGPLGDLKEDDVAGASELVRALALDYSVRSDPLYREWCLRQSITALCEAYRRRQPAILSVGSGREDQVAFNRRFRMRQGRVYTHPGKGNPDIVEPAGPTDPEVGVLAAWNEQGQLLGCLVNFTCHATTYSRDVSADYIAYLEQTIQGVYGSQAVVAFLPGAAGDITQVDNQSLREREFGEKWARRVGTRVGAEAIKVLVTAEQGDLAPLAAVQEVVRIPRRAPSPERLAQSQQRVAEGLAKQQFTTAWTFAKEIVLLDWILQRDPESEVEVQALQVGPAVFLTCPAEIFCETGLAIKQNSPFPLTYVVAYANGYEGYVPPLHAFEPDGGGYETVLTAYANLELTAEEHLRHLCHDLAHRLTPGPLLQPPQVERLGTPWEYGVLGPDRA